MLVGTLSRVAALLCVCGGLFAASLSGIWLDVPFVKQERNGCGAASVAMILKYWQRQQGQSGAPIDAEQIQQTIYSSKAHGIYASDIQHYLDKHGFRTFAFHGQWSDLKQHLENGRPLIVALNPARQTDFHFVVVTGLDWADNVVLTNDPAQRKLLKEERGDFEKQWKATGNWTLLAVPRQTKSASTSY